MEFNSQASVYQYNKNGKTPIYLEFVTPEFSPSLPKFLTERGWTLLNETERAQAKLEAESNSKARWCRISAAYGNMQDRIGQVRPEDKWGRESVEPGPIGSIYRYKGLCIAAFDQRNRRWDMAAVYDFGGSELRIPTQVALVRFLSWAFSAQGLIGLWGQVQSNGIVLAREKDLGGKALFIDLQTRKCITQDGEKMLSHYPIFLRPTSLAREDGQRLGNEELFAMLLSHSSLFDYDPLPTLLQKNFSLLSRQSQGMRVHREKIAGILQP